MLLIIRQNPLLASRIATLVRPKMILHLQQLAAGGLKFLQTGF
jgi:hypothetical protein